MLVQIIRHAVAADLTDALCDWYERGSRAVNLSRRIAQCLIEPCRRCASALRAGEVLDRCCGEKLTAHGQADADAAYVEASGDDGPSVWIGGVVPPAHEFRAGG